MHRLQYYLGWPYTVIEQRLAQLPKGGRLLVVLALATALIFTFFGKTLLHPNRYTFAHIGDDLKNYYTLKTYADQPVNAGLLHYNSMNYPFRDIVYYSDNTPLLSVGLKFLSQHFNGGRAINPIPVFNYLVVFNFLMASLLCFLILQRFMGSHTLAVLLSLCLPYLNPQANRIVAGTENLSLSMLLLANIYLLVLVMEGLWQRRKVVWPAAILLALLCTTAFIHLYYLVIFCFNTGVMLGAYGLYCVFKKQPFIKPLVLAGALPGIAMGLVMFIIKYTDEFYRQRNPIALGYGWEAWKTNLKGLYTSYPFYRLKFIIPNPHYVDYEAHTYLGSFVLYGLLAALLLYIGYRAVRRPLAGLKGVFTTGQAVLYLPMLAAGTVLFFIALGPSVTIGGHNFYNWLNVFNYLQLLTSKVTQFRCLGRFSWLFFWVVNIGFAALLARWLGTGKTGVVLAFYGLCFCLINDLTATGREFISNQYPNQFLRANMPPDALQLSAALKKQPYSAIMPLPFYLIGSEVYDQSLDPTYEQADFYFRLSAASKLPLMSSMISRTPLPTNQSLFNLYLNGSPDSLMAPLLKGKTIAVICNSDNYEAVYAQVHINNDSIRAALERTRVWPQTRQLPLVDSVGKFYIYSWKP